MAQRFNGWFQRLIDVWDGENWIADQPSSSIAWIYADAIHNSDYGLGRARSEIDVETLAALDALWTARGDSFNFYFDNGRSEEHTSELQSLMRISYAVFCFK